MEERERERQQFPKQLNAYKLWWLVGERISPCMELVSQESEINRHRIVDRGGKMITWKNNKRWK